MILAYIDAGTGTLILQMFLAGAAGIALFFRARLARFRGKRAERVQSDGQGSKVAEMAEPEEPSSDL